jgi:hypothetical protein
MIDRAFRRVPRVAILPIQFFGLDAVGWSLAVLPIFLDLILTKGMFKGMIGSVVLVFFIIKMRQGAKRGDIQHRFFANSIISDVRLAKYFPPMSRPEYLD